MTGLCPPSPEPLTVETALAQIGALRERAEKAERRIADVIAKLAPEVRGVVPADVVDAVGRVVGECGRMRVEVERLRGALADAHPMLGRAVECEREHGGLREQIETLTRERDEARARLAAKTDAHDRDGRVLLAISKALGRHATGDTAADVRRLVATLSSTRAAMRVMRATSANLGPGELWNRMEQAEHECDAARRHEACLMAERDRLRTYLARALRGCDPRERRAIEADMASEEGGEHG